MGRALHQNSSKIRSYLQCAAYHGCGPEVGDVIPLKLNLVLLASLGNFPAELTSCVAASGCNSLLGFGNELQTGNDLLACHASGAMPEDDCKGRKAYRLDCRSAAGRICWSRRTCQEPISSRMAANVTAVSLLRSRVPTDSI